MKKLIFSALSITLLTVGMTACSKTTKGKLSNDWKIESLNIKAVETESNGDQTITTTSYSGSTVTVTSQDFENGSASTPTTISGTITNPTFKINKDGTWRINRTLIFTETPTAGVTKTTTSVQMDSGTWSFIGKNKEEDFKKNERVLFNTLTTANNSTEVLALTNSSTTTTSNTSKTFKLGENVTIYTVTESKSKELELTSEAGSSTTTGNNSSSTVINTKMKLVQ